MNDKPLLKLHLGCGPSDLGDDFIHVDLANYSHIDHVTNINDLSMFEDGEADLIYSSQAIGYFDRVEVVGVLKEWRRVLRVGGTLRLSTPDFRMLMEIYQETGSLALILGPMFGRRVLDDGMIYQRTVYDLQSLSTLLNAVGFHRIRRWDWREVLPDGYDDCSRAYFPHMDFEHGILTNLNIEADKC